MQSLAVAIQNRMAEAFHVDIHPAAVIGRGVLIDHATGVVIGETAVVGDNVSLLHRVTLGGSGTNRDKRHPTIGMYVRRCGGSGLGLGCESGFGCSRFCTGDAGPPLVRATRLGSGLEWSMTFMGFRNTVGTRVRRWRWWLLRATERK